MDAIVRAATLLMLMSGAVDTSPESTKNESDPRPAPAWVKMFDQGTLNPKLQGLMTPTGWTLDLVADFPTVVNPVGMTFDDASNLYILEWMPSYEEAKQSETGRTRPGGSLEKHVTVTYRDGSTRQNVIMWKPTKDRVRLLKDKDGDGVYDTAETLLDDVELPSSILVDNGAIYLSGIGSVFRHQRSQPNGPFDRKEEILRGFCGFHHHQVSGMTLGADGLLYVTSGDYSNDVEGKNGGRIKVPRAGVIVRSTLDGADPEEFAVGFRNPYRDVVFDDKNNMFHADNDNEDGTKFMGCRLLHIVEGGDYGWRLREGTICCNNDMVRGSVNGELPGRMPMMLKTGRGSPAGVHLMYGKTIPTEYQGVMIYPDVFRRSIRAYVMQPKGATYAIDQEFEIIGSKDPLFRPCQCLVGPDGATYVVDWRTDSGGAGVLWGDSLHGRIYRLRWTGNEMAPALSLRPFDSWKKLASATDDELVATLRGTDDDLRRRAQRELLRRGKADRLLATAQDKDAPFPGRILAILGLVAHRPAGLQAALLAASQDENADVRRAAAEAIGRSSTARDEAASQRLRALINDADPSVQRSAAIALSRIDGDKSLDALLDAVKKDDGSDKFRTEGLSWAVERLGAPAMKKLEEKIRTGSAVDRGWLVQLYGRFRTEPAATTLSGLVAEGDLSSEHRRELILGLRNYMTEPAFDTTALVDYVAANPNVGAPVELAMLDVLPVMLPKSPANVESLLSRLLDSPDASVRAAAIRAIGPTKVRFGAIASKVQATWVSRLAPKLARRLENRQLDPAERMELLKVIRDLRLKDAIGDVEKLAAADGEIALKLEALRALDALDSKRSRPILEKMLGSSNAVLQREAIPLLAVRPDGIKLVAERFLDGKLPHDTLPLVAEGLRPFADAKPEMRELLGKVLKTGFTVTLDPKEIEKIEQLVMRTGNPIRGRNLITDATKLQCLTCHRLENTGKLNGAGPALTRVWETQSVPKLLESILKPSKEIKEGFQSYILADENGRVLTGLVTTKNDAEVTIKDAKGVEYKVPRSEIVELQPSPVSLMPDNSIANLDSQQFVDVIAFLKSRVAQDGLRRYPGEWKITVPLPEVSFDDPKATIAADMKWAPTAPDLTGRIDLRGKFAGQTGVLIGECYLFSEGPSKAAFTVTPPTVQLRTNDSNWSTGEAAQLPLKAGWNRILAKYRLGSDTGFNVQLQDSEGLYFGKPEAQ